MDLADYSQIIHLALEGENLDFDERLFYLGHLAMCAWLFKSIYLNEHTNLGTPRNERGDIAKEAWVLFTNYLNGYISAL